jgi:hypothetical protein
MVVSSMVPFAPMFYSSLLPNRLAALANALPSMLNMDLLLLRLKVCKILHVL